MCLPIFNNNFEESLEFIMNNYDEFEKKLLEYPFNAQKMCDSLCLQHKVNETLDNYEKGKGKIDPTIQARIDEIKDELAHPDDIEATNRKELREERKKSASDAENELLSFGPPQKARGKIPGVSSGGRKSKSKKLKPNKSNKAKSKKAKTKKAKSKK